MCVTSALEPRCFRHSLMSDSSCPINSFPCAKNILIGICSPFPTGGRPDRPSEWLSAEVAILGLALVQDATSSISVRSLSGAHEPFTRFPSQAAMFLLLLHGRPHRRVLNHCHRTLGIAVHRPCLFQRHHPRCNLDRFSCVHLMGMLPHPDIDICWRFADPAMAEAFVKSSPHEFVTFWKNGRRVLAACPWPV
jgi:hypothetical protein